MTEESTARSLADAAQGFADAAAVYGEAWRNPVPDHNYPHL